MKKILYYNWIQFDEKEKRGGGVTVYQKNIIEEFIKKEEYKVYFLSSGVEYNFFKKKTYIEKTKNIYGEKCKSYKIINSPVPAPGITILNFQKELEESKELKEIFKKFIDENGPFEVIHFNNLEGLSLDILDLKQIYRETKFIYSLHNYYFCCPKVNLWKADQENCFTLEKKECNSCIKYDLAKNKIKMLGNIFYFTNKIGISEKTIINLLNLIKSRKYKRNKNYENNNNKNFNYLKFKEIMNKKLNNIDKFLAVSDRVKEIAILEGIKREKIETLYIGTKFATTQEKKCIAPIYKTKFKIAYFGYMKKEKGFYFFIEALEKLESKIAKDIDILLATKVTDKEIVKKIDRLKERYNFVELKNGYTHNEVKELLKDVNLGVVPVLWEDNLPQVAIEFVANGVPIITSDLGGAQELSKVKEFIFKNNNINDFQKKLISIIKNRNLLDEYFGSQIELVTLEKHIIKLLEIYNKK